MVSHALADLVNTRSAWSQESFVFPVTLTFEDIEYPGYMLQTDITRVVQLGGVHEGGEIYRFTDEEAMESAIGMFTAACTRCLHELIETQPAR
ncbi:hypothetical protein [Trinickia sp. Y13]|uniref:hypothetical protein n=1 Tax=Trinickia sp. Y13 TaxID=2917807 RepID=UPI002405C32D|nr:hypothetical protein [Trinickia sp. Y13]MDG0027465.1 hypothetical protein [Trinickia sp. Y13]